jgi:E3 ubiquitin-protein ligase SHPRH
MIERWVERVSKADIVLTTFGVVQSDWDVAPPPIKRTRRSTATYVDNPRPRSALLLCDWRRVVIDEIQELDIAAASKSANMIKTIKRRTSLAISGTPAKVSIEDLASSLLFLGIDIPNQIWKRITSPAFASTFHAIFRNIVVRHTKANLSPEDMKMTIPRQTRYLVPIKLNRIERAVSVRGTSSLAS